MILQAITDAGGISADWTLVVAFGVIGFLLVTLATIVTKHFIKVIDALTDRVESLDGRVNTLEKIDITHDGEIKALKNEHDKHFEAIMSKLNIMNSE